MGFCKLFEDDVCWVADSQYLNLFKLRPIYCKCIHIPNDNFT